MSDRLVLVKDTYLDSVLQMSGTRAMSQSEGVKWATAAMATAANLETLAEMGLRGPELEGARANDLLLAVRADNPDAAAAAIDAGRAVLFARQVGAGGTNGAAGGGGRAARSLGEALARQAGSDVGGRPNVAIVSVPGPYASVEAHKALSAGLHVLLFSDNVSVDEEIELKDRGHDLGLLVMGPGAGTAMLGGTGLGFANVVKRGRVGVVAAAGTGAQEAMSLLDRWGGGVSHVIGVGGRDLSEAVDGRMAKLAVEALDRDPSTDAILLVSKPPSPEVARAVLSRARATPLVAALIGLDDSFEVPDGVVAAATLEEGVAAALAAIGQQGPDPIEGLEAAVDDACRLLRPEQTLVRGLFSGGTLCYESLVILSRVLGPVCSNTPIDKRYGLPAPADQHICLDLGEEEYTKGRPHPMIDPEARIELMRREAADPKVAVILVDVVLGYGSHPDPAGLLAPVCREIGAGGEGPRVVAYVLGTDGDPQGLDGQRAALEDAGCIVTATAARASLAAAALARRQPALVSCL